MAISQIVCVSKKVNANGNVQLDFDDGTGLWFENENGMSEWINQQFDDIDIQDMLKKFAVFGVSDNMANVPCTATFDSTDPNGNMIKVIDNV